jgi:ferredoxin
MFKVDKKVCIGCGSCSGVCPVDAISFDENGKSQIDQKNVYIVVLVKAFAQRML